MEQPADFRLPRHWPRVWALDIDRAKASALWLAVDRETDTFYIYSELVMPRHELALVASAIKKRVGWAPGLFDHVARKRSEQEGQRIVEALMDVNLDVFTVTADADAGAAEVAGRLATKRLKVFDTCTEWLAQYRAYRRNKDGDIVEESDGLMRAMDLLALAGREIAAPDAALAEEVMDEWSAQSRDSVTGY